MKSVFVHGHWRKTPSGKMVRVNSYWRTVKEAAEPDPEELDNYSDKLYDLTNNFDYLYDDTEILVGELKEKVINLGLDPDTDSDLLDELSYFWDDTLLDFWGKLEEFPQPEEKYLPKTLQELENEYNELKDKYDNFADMVQEYTGDEIKAEPYNAGDVWTKRAKMKWGTTESFVTAGYLLSDGTLLNMGSYGIRGQDHREIATFMGEADNNWNSYCPGVYQNKYSTTGYMLCFMKRANAIRISYNNNNLIADILKGQRITWNQRMTLQKIFGSNAILGVINPENAGGDRDFESFYLNESDIDTWEEMAS